MSGPELIHSAEGMLIVDGWESFAMLGTRIREGKTAPQPMVVLVVTGRINNTQDRMTAAAMVAPDEAIVMAKGLVHSATHLDGQPLDLDDPEE